MCTIDRDEADAVVYRYLSIATSLENSIGKSLSALAYEGLKDVEQG